VVCTACVSDQRRERLLHRLVMGEPVGLVVHHVDEDPLNYQCENLTGAEADGTPEAPWPARWPALIL
jgi:hypothetical protein